MPGAVIRKTVPLTPQEVALLELTRAGGTPEHMALVRLVGAEVATSEAATLHALLAFALSALGEQIALDDYEKLAAARDAEDEAHERTMRRRVRAR